MNLQSAIKVEGLSKNYKSGIWGEKVPALLDVTFDVKPGEIFGLLGPNGAGKTTLVKVLLGSLKATTGHAFIDNIDINKPAARQQIGFLPENHRFPGYLTGSQLLNIYSGMAGMSTKETKSKAQALLELVGMYKWRNTRIKKYSKGMMQRVGLAQALITDPNIIFLDEPTDGVDPIGRREIRDILQNLKKTGKTIFLNSHLLAEVEAVCDRVAVLDKGHLLRVGPVAGLVSSKPQYRITTAERSDDLDREMIKAFPGITMSKEYIIMTVESPAEVNNAIDWLRERKIDLLAVVPQKLSLEDSFVHLIKGDGQEEAS